jgi:outer membrane protein, heavy metal efflux system
MKYAVAILLCLIIVPGRTHSQAAFGPPPPAAEENLHSLIEEALAHNPDIAAQLYSMEAAVRRIPQSGALDDPELILKLMEIPGTRFNEAMYANVELMQMIPFPTKLSARRSLANLLSEHAHHDHMEKILQVVTELKTAMAMLWYGREALSITKSNLDVLNRILRASETAYSVGRSTQQEVLKTRIEVAKLISDEATVQEQIATAENMMRRVLNRPADAPLGHIEMDSPSPLPSMADLVSYADRYKPMLMHDSLNVVEKEMNVRLMKEEYLPDFKLSLEYVRLPMTMENRWSVSAGITLPFAPWTLAKAASRVQEAEAEQQMLSSMYTSSRNMVRSEIRSKYASLTSLATQIRQYKRSILPMLSQSIDLLLTDYETGRTSYLMVMDGYRMYNDMRRDLAMAKMKYEETKASLEREIGATDLHSIGTPGKDE